jgi:Secretion system C-terminal sorting domain
MNKLYPKKIPTAILILFMLCHFLNVNAQCPHGYVPSGVAFDSTVSTGSGNYATQFSFPKIDPQNGMVICVKLCLTITGRVSMFLENNVTSSAIYNINYKRKDTLTGPGLSSPLTNQVTVAYGPYNLAATDGVPLSGPDFQSIGPDTVLNSVSICHTITDSVDLSQFYGSDSVTYTYSINAGATVTGSGDYLFSVGTQGTVNYKLEYCICPIVTLPLNVHDFFAKKIGADEAELKWTGVEDPEYNYKYEVELSRDGHHFSSIGVVAQDASINNVYKYIYSPEDNKAGMHFFRIKQVYSNGYSRFSEIRPVELASSIVPKFSIYPNPSNGIVGIKFDNIPGGQMLLEIINTHGQTVLKKEVAVMSSTYLQMTSLQKGVYWLRMTNIKNELSSVNQLIIK